MIERSKPANASTAHGVRPCLIGLVGRLEHRGKNLVVGRVGLLDDVGQRHRDLPFGLEQFLQPGDVPLLLDGVLRHVLTEQLGEHAMAQVGDALGEVVAVEQRVAVGVHHLALVVGDVVVLEQLLADIEVAGLDLALRALDRARDRCRPRSASPSGSFSGP
jgi:hypothetical protein